MKRQRDGGGWGGWGGGLLFQPQAPRGTSIKRPPWQEDVVNILKPKNADLGFLPLLSKKGAAAAAAEQPAGADAQAATLRQNA